MQCTWWRSGYLLHAQRPKSSPRRSRRMRTRLDAIHRRNPDWLTHHNIKAQCRWKRIPARPDTNLCLHVQHGRLTLVHSSGRLVYLTANGPLFGIPGCVHGLHHGRLNACYWRQRIAYTWNAIHNFDLHRHRKHYAKNNCWRSNLPR